MPGSGFTSGHRDAGHQIHPGSPIAQPGTMGSGMAIITFQGLINTSGIVSAISKFIS